MEGQLTDQPDIHLAGVSFFGDPFSAHAGWTEENEIGRLWQRFFRLREILKETAPKALSRRMYEVHLIGDEFLETGEYEVFLGYEITSREMVPPLMLRKSLPGGRRALFTVKGESIADMDCYASMQNWLEQQGLQREGGWTYNLYDDRFLGMDRLSESVLDVVIPVR